MTDDNQITIPDIYCPACGHYDHAKYGNIGKLLFLQCGQCGTDFVAKDKT
jgi:translation initiation factor 2 beta subunit (eIF-2beta)/eIF-5